MAATVLEELHVAELVRFCVLPSLYVPVAVSCSFPPIANELLAAVTAIDCSVAAVTERATALEVTPLWLAAMLLEPIANAVASPLGLMVAAAVFEELHVTEFVRFWVVPSVKVPVAVN